MNDACRITPYVKAKATLLSYKYPAKGSVSFVRTKKSEGLWGKRETLEMLGSEFAVVITKSLA